VSSNKESESETQPVYVIEAIPTGGEHEVAPRQIESEGIPIPPHLRLYGEIGRGGTGYVHPAVDRNLLRRVALKRLDKELAREPMYREGFIAEAQITGQLEHPNIVPVYELAVSNKGIPYFTMKLVQGARLDEWLQEDFRRPGSRERLQDGLDIFLKVCDAVAYAHHRGVIHRDLKPENIMVAAFGQVYVMDWGLARLIRTRPASGADSQMEAPGEVGTPAYMSPEQARGNPAEMDERSDVFGLGAVLYEIVCGQVPYGNLQDSEAILERARHGQVIPIDRVAERYGISKRLRDIVNKAIAPLPANRYQRVMDLQRDVREFLRGGLHLPHRTFAPGSLIIREGDRGVTAYMIVSGRCRAFRTIGAAQGSASAQETLATMGPGDVFGEMALILDEPRAASVEAVDQVTVLVLDKKTMVEGLGTDRWTGSLVHALAQRFHALEQQVRASGMRRG
jgi:CRP-like cAMP-binding protein/tRNA A-37 threonylcarbamoyl transferase component Bud32